MDKHSTLDPVMVSVVSSNPTGGNFLTFFKPLDVYFGLKCKCDLIVKNSSPCTCRSFINKVVFFTYLVTQRVIYLLFEGQNDFFQLALKMLLFQIFLCFDCEKLIVFMFNTSAFRYKIFNLVSEDTQYLSPTLVLTFQRLITIMNIDNVHNKPAFLD